MNRPKITEAMILEAAKQVAAELEGDAESIAKHYRHGMDGYELARKLDRNCFWDFTMADVEVLDGMRSIVHELHRKAEKEWGEQCQPEPPLPIGAKIKQGVIEGICEHSPGKYRVKENGCTTEKRWKRWLLVNFEDAESA